MQSRKCNTVNALHCTQVGYCMKFSFNQYTKFEVYIFPEGRYNLPDLHCTKNVLLRCSQSCWDNIKVLGKSTNARDESIVHCGTKVHSNAHFLRHHSADSADLSNLLSHHCHHSSVISHNTHNAKLTILMKWFSYYTYKCIWNWETDCPPIPSAFFSGCGCERASQ